MIELQPILASDAINQGRLDYPDKECPYEPPDYPLYEEGFHGSYSVGLKKVRLDFRALWKVGYDIEAFIQSKGANAINIHKKDSDI